MNEAGKSFASKSQIDNVLDTADKNRKNMVMIDDKII